MRRRLWQVPIMSGTPPRSQMPSSTASTMNHTASGSSGPSQKDPALITSTWGIGKFSFSPSIWVSSESLSGLGKSPCASDVFDADTEPSAGWKTPFLMMACYFIGIECSKKVGYISLTCVLAFMIAIAHLLLFRYIDGKEADGPDRVAPQSYITTASNILANLFGFALRAALAIAFAQYLWHLFRVSTMKVSTIELLFTIRTNLFLLLRPAVIHASPVLFALAALMWASQVVTSFPPGALTVIASQKTTYAMRSVPTYDAAYVSFQSGLGVI